MSHAGTLVLIMAVAVLAPLLAYGLGRWIRVPLVIFEIVLGILIGPDVLGWVHEEQVIDTLADLGLCMLIFLAGYEIEFATVRGDTLRRSVWAWVVSLALGLGLAFALSGADVDKSFVIGTALTSTALGTILPILRDSGDLRGRFGTVVMAFGAVGEFGPIIAMALLLSGRGPGESAVLLVAFAAVTAAAVFWALRPRPPWFSRVIAATLHSSGQFAVRFVMLLLTGMLALAYVFGLDSLLGAFAAGMLTRLVLQGAAPGSGEEILGRVEAMGFGFLVPLFFVVTGVEFDLASLLDGGRALALLPVFLLLFLVVRGLPVYLLAPRDQGRSERAALSLYASTCLPLVVAITTIGLEERVVGAGEAAALVGAAMISVLVFPLLALRLRTARGEARVPEGASPGFESW
ncbi:sodium/hydrogen exchanger [Streptomyces spinoverrucosus]|uniref:Sodium/hydrogen exchanger n=1 Tax=Streptomyces spinoverrucosus TaxID=284043 RepID=A0A4Y3VI21_9ACTN|nr:cation:proton antiporter [Streptomyces spinoverrucosus]GEC05311.1 sodium/hydrogen exchanger [Streptomyces spinoverrucosus]GHB79206.1 sodium/hydrogen exchanger [Streptomyces spinoverrucosus]